MKVNIDIDDRHTEPSITIQTNEWTDELEEIVAMIKRQNQKRLFAVESDQTILLDPKTIDFVYAEKRKIFACLRDRNVELKMKLYEIEEILAPYNFMRFSKSVIGNLNLIERFELSFNGNLCVYFHSGNKEFIFVGNGMSMLKQTAIHFILSMIVYFSIALPMGWIPFTVSAIIWSSVFFIIIYAVFWGVYYLYYKKIEAAMNENLKKGE